MAMPFFVLVLLIVSKGDFVMTTPNDPESVLTPEELKAGRDRIAAANINNVLHHCRKCDYEWVASHAEACRCGSKSVERIMCWQFPDD